MGKLHTLRRAILREPQKWHGSGRAYAALRDRNGQWVPLAHWSFYNDRSYRAFVLSVLKKHNLCPGSSLR